MENVLQDGRGQVTDNLTLTSVTIKKTYLFSKLNSSRLESLEVTITCANDGL